MLATCEERNAEWPEAQTWEQAMALTLLASSYCRSGRVILAEGLLREACRLLRLTRNGLSSTWQAPHGCHASCAARVAWLHAQLLTALPKRVTEAEQWAGVASHIWQTLLQRSSCGIQLPSAFGDLQALTGAGRQGSLNVMVLFLGRVYSVES